MDSRAAGDPYESAGKGPDSNENRSILDFLALLLHYRRLLIGLPLLVCAAAVAFSFLLPREYTVESRFIPEGSNPSGSRLAGLAAQFGIDVAGGETGESVDFYAELLESNDLLRSLALTEFAFPEEAGGDTLRGDLVTLLRVKGDTPEERTRNAVDRLGDQVTVRPDPAAKIVTVRTTALWPALAVDINMRLLELLSEFNLERRQSRAAAERQFLESRVQEAEQELIAAEATLEQFLSENRRYAESPQLSFEYARLQRKVSLQHQLYTSLAQGYEQARVDEVRNTPVITVIDQPRGPARRTAPRIAVNGLLGLLLGILIAVTLVVVKEVMANERRRNPRRFEEVRNATRSSVAGFVPGDVRRESRRPDGDVSVVDGSSQAMPHEGSGSAR